MLFSISFIAMFTIGGLSGVIHASPPTDAQQQDTYFVVAHFHYVLVGGSLLGIFSGIYYWWPKFTGYFLNEKLGIANWALMLIGFNFTFAPMHWLGMDGMPRRIYTYAENMGWEGSNLAATIGGFILGLGILVFIINVFYSRMRKQMAGNDPWDGRTLEWATTSPPPVHDFDEIPQVKYRDDFWFQKYPETISEYFHDEPDQVVPSGAQEELDDEEMIAEDLPVVSGSYGDHSDDHGHGGIHLPDQSYYPFILSLGLAIFGIAFVTDGLVLFAGAPVFLWGLLGWSMEPVNDPA
jgi:cytochrome c oxidase subunit 1